MKLIYLGLPRLLLIRKRNRRLEDMILKTYLFSTIAEKKSIKTLYSQGIGTFGALGNGNLLDSKCYKRIEAINGDEHQIVNIAVGMGHSCIVLESGELLLSGRPFEIDNLLKLNRLRMVSSFLARMMQSNSSHVALGDLLLSPTQIEGFDSKVISIKTIGGLNTVLTENGSVYNFGATRWEKSLNTLKWGDIDAERTIKTPKKANMPPAESISCGLQHSIACTTEGDVYCWGAGERGQLGNNLFTTSLTPVRVKKLPKSEKVVSVDAGFHHSVLLTDAGNVYVFGRYMSMIAKPEKKTKYSSIFEDEGIPRRVFLPEDRKIVEICSSSAAIILRAEDDSLWVLGMSEFDRTLYSVPIPVCNYIPNGDSPDVEEQIYLPKTAMLKKGHGRVSVVYPKVYSDKYHIDVGPAYVNQKPVEPKFNETNLKLNQVYEIVLTEGIAFFIPADDIIFERHVIGDSTIDGKMLGDDVSTQYSIVDYCVGWQHRLIVLQNDN